MADRYVKHTGDNTTGTSWATAFTTLASATAADVAGDRILVSSQHVEATTASQTHSFAGTFVNPTTVLSVNESTLLAESLATTVNSSAGYPSHIFQGNAILEGLDFKITAANSGSIIFGAGANTNFVANNCKFRISGSSGASSFLCGTTTAGQPSKVTFNNCFFGITSTAVFLEANRADVTIYGGGIITGSIPLTYAFNTSPTDLFKCEISNFDFSLAATTFNFFKTGVVSNGRLDVINCKMPVGWSGSLFATLPQSPIRAVMWNCENAAKHIVASSAGQLFSNEAIYKTGGATEGTTPTSWMITTSANTNESLNQFYTEDVTIPNDTVGSKTVTVDFACAAQLDNSKIWIEVEYCNTSGLAGTTLSSKRSSLTATPVNCSTSSTTWVGLTTQIKQKVSLTINPQRAGNVYLRVYVGIPSTTVYLDYAATLT